MMTPDRFRRLAEAYGCDLARWPVRERGPAAAFAAVHAVQAAQILSAERALDARFDAFDVAPPSAQLRDRVLALAPAPRPERAWRWLAAASLGIGLAGSAAAGVAAGFVLAPPGVTRLISGPAPSNDALAGLVGDAGEG
jgi:hypothetical protein